MSGSPISPFPALVDTSFIYAVMDRRSKQYQEAIGLYDKYPGTILLPTVTLPELAYLVNQIGGSSLVAKTIRSLRASQMEFVDALDADYDSAAEILEKYDDSRIDFVDACIMVMAERLHITHILTFDRRDFGLYRPAHCEYFELLP